MCSSCVNHMPTRAQQKQSSNNDSSIGRVHQRRIKKVFCGRRNNHSTDSSSSCSLQFGDRGGSRPSQIFPISRLPLPVLVHIAEKLSFSEANTFRMVSKKFNLAEKTARNSRKRLSFSLLSQLFPKIIAKSHGRKSLREGIGFLQTVTPMRMFLGTTPSAVLTEVDLSSFSSFGSVHLVNILESMDASGLFGRVSKLDVSNCVLETGDLEWLSGLMPEVWFVSLSIQHLVFSNELGKSQLTQDDKRAMLKMMGCLEFSGDCTSAATIKPWTDVGDSGDEKRCLEIVALLTRIFPKLEVIQMER